MTTKTKSELLFEEFCELHHIPWEPIPVADSRRPDYLVELSSQAVYIEVKQIDRDCQFDTDGLRSSRTVGSHVRQKISESKKQVQFAKHRNAPGVLLIYNNLDPLQAFGTEPHDFISAMYGERTVVLTDGKIANTFLGRNSLLRNDQNTSFSAVAHMRRSPSGPTVRFYENIFASNHLDYASLPTCIEIFRFEHT